MENGIFESKYAQNQLFLTKQKLIRAKINTNNVDLFVLEYVLNGLSTYEKLFQLKLLSGGKEIFFSTILMQLILYNSCNFAC